MRVNNKKGYSRLFIIFVFLFLTGTGRGAIQSLPMTDTTEIRQLNWEGVRLDNYRNDPDFQYQQNDAGGPGFGLFIQWLFLKLFGKKVGTIHFPPYLKYVIFVLLLVGLMLLIVRTRYSGVFSSTNAQVVSFTEEAEPVGEDLDGSIANAIDKNQFRLATRMLFLQILQKLDHLQLISREAGKTNHDYFRELISSKLEKEFVAVSTIYEYVWYGNFEPDKETFMSIRSRYGNFLEKLNG